MKISRDASINGRNNNRKSFVELSLSLIFSLWCLVFLFYARLGRSHGNRDSYIADGSNNRTNGMLIEFNIDINCNNSTVRDHNSADSKYSVRETKRLEEVIWSVLGYTALVCTVQPREEQKTNKPEKKTKWENFSSHLS